MALVIGGHMGSGKSVLRKALYFHPDIVTTDDFGTFCKIDVSYWQHVKGLQLKWRYPRQHSLLSQAFAARYLVMIWFQSRASGRVRACDIETVLKRMFRHASVVGDTYCRYAHRLNRTVSIPSLKHVVIYRDCRDVAAVMERRLKGRWSRSRYRPKDAPWIRNILPGKNLARHWVSYIQEMERHRDSVYVIRYEDLVADPRAVLTPLGQWLGVDPHYFQYGFIHTNSIGDYRQLLSDKTVAEILTVAGPTMERLGYI